jgi:D-alanine-D-alanine ligase-like ATP-grasp enzyme
MTLFYKRRSIDGVKKLKKISKSTIMVLEEAEKHGITWEKMQYTDTFKLSLNDEVKYFHAQTPSETTEFAYYCCKNKQITNRILENAGVSVSNGYLLRFTDGKKYRLRLFEALKKPLVVKPADGYQANNVFINITTQEAYISSVHKIFEDSGQEKVDILVEEMFRGDEYRILATQKKILSVIQRIPANVEGDGKSSIQQLIQIKNKQPLRVSMPTYHEIVVDGVVKEHLKEKNMTLDTVLPAGEQIFLRPQCPMNVSLGGDTVDVTDSVDPSVCGIVQKIMKSIPGLSLTGIDFMTKDIHAPQTPENYRIIEINASPSLDWNAFPLIGKKRDVAYEFLKIMFPDIE